MIHDNLHTGYLWTVARHFATSRSDDNPITVQLAREDLAGPSRGLCSNVL